MITEKQFGFNTFWWERLHTEEAVQQCRAETDSQFVSVVERGQPPSEQADKPERPTDLVDRLRCVTDSVRRCRASVEAVTSYLGV